MLDVKGETLKHELEIPKELYNGTIYYMKKTMYWVSNDMEKNSFNDLVSDLLKDYLRCEMDHPTDAEDCLKEDMKHMLDFLN